jgi:hypothetical protein
MEQRARHYWVHKIGHWRRVFLSTCATMAQTHSAGTTGQEMLRYCGTAGEIVSKQLSASQVARSPEEAMIEGFCVGAIAGVSFLAAISTKDSRYPICVPENAPKGQLVSAVVRYLHNHPERLTEDFLWTIMNALREAWPCPVTGQNPAAGSRLPQEQRYTTPPQIR